MKPVIIIFLLMILATRVSGTYFAILSSCLIKFISNLHIGAFYIFIKYGNYGEGMDYQINNQMLRAYFDYSIKKYQET